jgi:hypothetical protein
MATVAILHNLTYRLIDWLIDFQQTVSDSETGDERPLLFLYFFLFTTAPPTTTLAPTTTTTTTTTSKPTTTTTTVATTTTAIASQRLDANVTFGEEDIILVTIGENIRVIEVDEGVTYRIRCVAPDHQVTEWIAENGQDLNDDGHGFLKIQRASRANIGLFRCRLQGEQSNSASVDVRLSSSKRGKEPFLKTKIPKNFFKYSLFNIQQENKFE